MNYEENIKNEEILLLKLCRLEFSGEQVEKIRSLISVSTDWDHFRVLVNAHGVSALVCHNLERLNLLNSIPKNVTALLRGALMISLSHNTFNTESTSEVLRLLNKANIKSVILKGLALENTVYGNAGIRQMSDVDILIAREECIRARKILMINGYVSLPVKSVFHKLIIANLGKHLPSLLKNGTSIEIHHELFGGRKNVLTTMLYETSYQVFIKGEKAYFPQPLIFFLYLVKHLSIHELNNESQLRLYTDLVVLLEKHREEIINHDLLGLASQADMTEMLASKLLSLREFWKISFPEWMNDVINSRSNPDSINRFVFFLRSPKDNPSLDRAMLYRQNLSDIPGIHRKFLFLLGDIFPTVSFMKERYSSPNTLKALLYYPHRLGKIWWLLKR